MEETDISFENIRDSVWSSDINDSFTVWSVSDLKSLQTKHHHHLAYDGQIEHSTYIYNSLSEDRYVQIEHILNITEEHVRLCNFKDNSNDKEKENNVLKKIPTIFSVHHIIDDILINKKKHRIKVLLFARQESNCSLLLKEVLIFMTAFNFVPDDSLRMESHQHISKMALISFKRAVTQNNPKEMSTSR
ncbi:unnamed protein product [Mytilus coruscus]|uniref:Uncharacterized protein n=1 Tax=Mytilus coruscus TaxID=42192 RepID=A0A6J8BX28_MYTCO|nr:unnamed protein product [Mytilus coruscus]